MFPGLINKCGLLMQQKKMEPIIYFFLQKIIMEYFALVWRQVHHLKVRSNLNQHQSKKVFQLILLYSKMMMEITTCTLAAFGAVNYNVGEPGLSKQKVMVRFFIYR